MSSPVEKTFQALATTANPHAADTLIAALGIDDEHIRASAVKALLRRRGTKGLVEVIRRLSDLPEEALAAIHTDHRNIATPLKQSLLHGDTELRQNALALVREAEMYDQVGALAELLTDESNELHELAAQTLTHLVNRLYEHCTYAKETKSSGKYLRDAPRVKLAFLTELDKACTRFDELVHPEELVEGILTLGDPANFAVKKALTQAPPACREIASGMLMTSTHPGLMQLVLDCMSTKYPFAVAIQAIARRVDPEFVCHLLRSFPKQLSPIQQANFRQIESLAWIQADALALETIPEALQSSLMDFVAATGLSSRDKLVVQEWLVRHGTQSGRLSAVEVLSQLDNDEVQDIVRGGLDSDDPNVQAWATAQLRSREVPETFKMLIDRLDSTLPAVRDAARRELESFDLHMVLDLFEELDPIVCRKAGELIQKIDPDCTTKLLQEITSPICRRRIRAARAALATGLHLQIEPAVIAMLDDEDALVRQIAVETLGRHRTEEALLAITRMFDDPSQRVREKASKALERLKQPT